MIEVKDTEGATFTNPVRPISQVQDRVNGRFFKTLVLFLKTAEIQGEICDDSLG